MSNKNKLSSAELKELRTIAGELLKIKGDVRGACSQAFPKCLEDLEGKGSVEKLERVLEKVGYPIDFKKVSAAKWYPVGIDSIWLTTARKLFKWSDAHIITIGRCVPKCSLLTKFVAKYIIPPQKSYERIAQQWGRYFTVGIFEISIFNEKEKYTILRIRDLKLHPNMCLFWIGYFHTIASFVLKSKKIQTEETRCMFKGDTYHEFRITWK